jgi:hypothetical protein
MENPEMHTKPAVGRLFAAFAVILMAAFAGAAYPGTDQPGQGEDAPDCKAKPDDARCRGAE